MFFLKLEMQVFTNPLHMNTNAPFGYGEKQEYVIDVTDASKTYSIFDVSDEIGHIFPDVKIICNESGNLIITNQTANCELRINNCVSGERIEINGDTMIINSSNSSHKILDDFNYEFLRIGNTFTNRENLISASLKCRLEISYFPIIKEAP